MDNTLNQALEAFDVPKLTIDQILEAFPEVSPIDVLRWVFNQPGLRLEIITRADDLITLHKYGQIGAKARNRKLSPSKRRFLARHAAGLRWHKGQSLPGQLDLFSSLFKVNGNGSSVNGAGAPE